MRRLMIVILGLMLVSCRSVKSSTETAVKTEREEIADLAISSQAERYRMQHLLEDMFVKYNGYKDITLYDPSLATKENGYVAPMVAKVVVRDTVYGEKRSVVHDTTCLVVHDTVTIHSETRDSMDLSNKEKNDKRPPFDGFLSFAILMGLIVVTYKICRRIE